jgi:hypothetical protein
MLAIAAAITSSIYAGSVPAKIIDDRTLAPHLVVLGRWPLTKAFEVVMMAFAQVSRLPSLGSMPFSAVSNSSAVFEGRRIAERRGVYPSITSPVLNRPSSENVTETRFG